MSAWEGGGLYVFKPLRVSKESCKKKAGRIQQGKALKTYDWQILSAGFTELDLPALDHESATEPLGIFKVVATGSSSSSGCHGCQSLPSQFSCCLQYCATISWTAFSRGLWWYFVARGRMFLR